MIEPAHPPIRVTVYCAASPKLKRKYFDFAERLGKQLVAHGMELVYGGGGLGLMGAVADTVLDGRGKVTGIIPTFMQEREWTHPRVTDMHIVNTMHDRKTAMVAQCDAIIALPGGCGTFEELLEAFTWKRLDLIDKPILVVNQDGYYDALWALFERGVEEGFMDAAFQELWHFVQTPEEAVSVIAKTVRR